MDLGAAKLLLVEDDPALLELLEYRFRNEGYNVRATPDGDEALMLAAEDAPDLVILDWMIEGTSGIEVCRRLRRDKATAHVPIIMLTAREAEDDRIRGLDTGADDYLTKPFAFVELLARVRVLLRRGQPTPEKLIVGELSLDCIRRKVTRSGDNIELAPKEFSILEYLMRNTGRVVSKTMIMEHVWDYNFDPQTNVVEARVCRLLGKIDKGFDEPLIHTVRGVGYVLE